MNRYQVVLSNNDMLRIVADGVGRDGTYLYFYEHNLDAEGKPKTINDDGDLEVTKVAEFAAWNGWNYMGVNNPPETPAKAEVKGLTGAEIAEQLRQAVAQQAKGNAEPKASYDPYSGRDTGTPYMGDN